MVAGTVSAKTDRLEGIIDFTEQRVSNERIVSEKSDDIRLSENLKQYPYLISALVTVVILVSVGVMF